MHSTSLSLRSPLTGVPGRLSRKNIVVLKFGGTTMGATAEQGRIKLARQTIAGLIDEGKHVVPVFSAYRRGRSGNSSKFSVTDLLENHQAYVDRFTTLQQGVDQLEEDLLQAHLKLINDLECGNDTELVAEITQDIRSLKNNIALACSAFEVVPSINDVIITGGERLTVKIMAAYLNKKHAEGEFPLRAAPVTALELGIYTDQCFGMATINWAAAVDHAREVIVGQYLEKKIIPIVTGFDGIYDPHNAFKSIMQVNQDDRGNLEKRFADVYRTSLGRGGSDLTATFLGLALNAEYVGFCKETPGVLTGDDLLVGDAAHTLRHLDYDLATEAGNIFSRAVEPVRHGSIPVHIFDPARPDLKTIVSDVSLPPGLYLIERPKESVNINSRAIADEPGALLAYLQIYANFNVNVEEIRHQRSGTDCIVCSDDEVALQRLIDELNQRGFESQSHFTWYLRVIGNITEDLASEFNRFMSKHEPLTLAAYQVETRVLTATVARNRAGAQLTETKRIETIVRQIHNQLIVPGVRKENAESNSTTSDELRRKVTL